jgi:uncharacterized protein (DUF2252 family)
MLSLEEFMDVQALRRQGLTLPRSLLSSATTRPPSAAGWLPAAHPTAGGPRLSTLWARSDRREVLRRYYFGDFARKVVGVGSVGTEAFVLLLLGDRTDEPLFLQLKEAQESTLAPYAGKSEFAHQGERVVKGQQLMQAASDPFLGWSSGLITRDDVPGVRPGGAKEYYVRQLRDMKGSMSIGLMDPHQLDYYGRLCGWALARAHARTGRATLVSGYLGSRDTFDRAIADFAVAYARQNEKDYRCLMEAVSAGRVLATVER